MLEKIIKKILQFEKKKKLKSLTNVDWKGNGYCNVEFDFDRTSVATINEKASFRNNCVVRVRDNAKLKIGEFSNFNNGCIITCRELINIGDRVSFGPNVMIFDHDHDYKSNDYIHNFKTKPIVIEDDVWVGANVTILKGSIIKKGAVIGANSVVCGTVEEQCVYTSANEKRIRKYEKASI
jgi:acetyltransferase-like isoleucine patch superfamily enzyme